MSGTQAISNAVPAETRKPFAFVDARVRVYLPRESEAEGAEAKLAGVLRDIGRKDIGLQLGPVRRLRLPWIGVFARVFLHPEAVQAKSEIVSAVREAFPVARVRMSSRVREDRTLYLELFGDGKRWLHEWETPDGGKFGDRRRAIALEVKGKTGASYEEELEFNRRARDIYTGPMNFASAGTGWMKLSFHLPADQAEGVAKLAGSALRPHYKKVRVSLGEVTTNFDFGTIALERTARARRRSS